jgi:hypothetical protein
VPVLGDRSFFDGPPPNFRYAHTHFALDALDSHAAAADDPNRDVPNPAKAHAAARVAAARAALTAAQTRHDTVIAELVAAARPGHPSVITNELRNQLTADVQAAEDELSDARRTARAIPARARLAQTAPDTMVLDTETKLITHAIRMAAYNSESALARLLHAHYPAPRTKAGPCSAKRSPPPGTSTSATAPCTCGSTRSPRPAEPVPWPPSARN